MRSGTWFRRHQEPRKASEREGHGVALAMRKEQIVVGEQEGEETKEVAPRTVLEKDSKA